MSKKGRTWFKVIVYVMIGSLLLSTFLFSLTWLMG